jgi:putative hemolysin
MSLPALAASLAVLLLLSGLFSGSETALFSIPALRLREMAGSRKAGERAVARVMARPRRVLVTILIGNLLVNILASALASAAVLRATGGSGWAVVASTLAMTLLVLVAGEIAPKTVAYRFSETIAAFVARPLILLGAVFTPIRWPLVRLTDAVLGEERHDDRVPPEEIDAMVRLAHEHGEVEAHERDLIRGVFELGSSPVEDVMTPRTEVLSFAADTPVAEVRDDARRSGFSKFPVSEGGPDEMKGFVTALDLLLADDDARIGELARPVEWVPEVKPAITLLEEFRDRGKRLSFVVDEHGHFSGIVTLTDLLEEISGEIIERGDLHKVLYRRVAKNRVVVPGRMEIRFFNEEFGTALAAEESETMAGLLLERTGRIPATGEELELEGMRVRVVKAEPQRIVTLEIELPAPHAPEAAS